MRRRPKLLDYTTDRKEMLYRSGDIFKWLAEGKLKVRVHPTRALLPVRVCVRALRSAAAELKPEVALVLCECGWDPLPWELWRMHATACRSRVREDCHLDSSYFGCMQVAIDKTFPLVNAAQGHEYLEAGKSTGKVLYKIA